MKQALPAQPTTPQNAAHATPGTIYPVIPALKNSALARTETAQPAQIALPTTSQNVKHAIPGTFYPAIPASKNSALAQTVTPQTAPPAQPTTSNNAVRATQSTNSQTKHAFQQQIAP